MPSSRTPSPPAPTTDPWRTEADSKPRLANRVELAPLTARAGATAM